MGGSYTEAQKKATAKYQKTLASLSIRINRELYEEIRQAAENEGVPLRQFVLSAIYEKMGKRSAED